MKIIPVMVLFFSLLSCADQKPKPLTEPRQYTVVTADNDTLELSSTFTFSSGDDANVWIWISNNLDGVCGFILRPHDDNETIPVSNEKIRYYSVSGKIIPNKLKPSIGRLPTMQDLNNKKSPCDRYRQ
jgi:hypothetical protein